MIKYKDGVKDLITLEQTIPTRYQNVFPWNCGRINEDGTKSYDCIGLIKSYINKPDELLNRSPVGDYVIPGQVIPDTTEIGILNLCTDVKWHNFNGIHPMEYLYMDGHGAWFVGEYTDPSGVVNCIECTTAFGGGVVSSYIDLATGIRYDHKGGTPCSTWEAHGKLSKYIDYSDPKPTGKTVDDIVDEIIAGKFGNYPERRDNLYNYFQDLVNKRFK